MKLNLTNKEVLTIVSALRYQRSIQQKVQNQYDLQVVAADNKPKLKYHTINSSSITYFEYDPLLSITVLAQEKTRQWLPNFRSPWHERAGRKKIASLNGMLFSYIDYATRKKTTKSIPYGTCMKDMGTWLNKPYINNQVVNMIYNEHRLIIQNGVKEKEYPKAWFIISGYACVKDGEKDSTNYSSIAMSHTLTNRTIYGQKANGNIAMITMKKATFYDCQRLALKMGLTNAIILDGGGSTRFNLFGKKKNPNGFRQIANALLIYSKLTDADVEYPMRQYIKF